VVLLGFDGGVAHVAGDIHQVKVFGRLFLQCPGKGSFPVLANNVKELGGGDFVAGLEELGDSDIGHFVDEFGSSFGLGFGAIEQGLVLEVVLVTAFSPVGEVLVVKACGMGAEVFEDGAVLVALVEEVVDALADGLGEASDFAGALARAGGAGVEGGDYCVCERSHGIFDF